MTAFLRLFPIVNCRTDLSLLQFMMEKWRDYYNIRDISYHLEKHPFASKCRAYGRIHQYNLDGVYTPKCYGWMKVVTHDIRNEFRSGIFPGPLLQLGAYATVKEYIPIPTREEHVEDIIRGIQGLHSIGITVNDCRPCNYRGSKLVDMGHVIVDRTRERSYGLSAEDRLIKNIEDVRREW